MEILFAAAMNHRGAPGRYKGPETACIQQPGSFSGLQQGKKSHLPGLVDPRVSQYAHKKDLFSLCSAGKVSAEKP